MNSEETGTEELLQLANELAGQLRIVIKAIGDWDLIVRTEDLKKELVMKQLTQREEFILCEHPLQNSDCNSKMRAVR